MNETDSHQQIQDFALVHWENGEDWTSRVRTVDHYINSTKGIDSLYWRVPAVKNNGCVDAAIVIQIAILTVTDTTPSS